MNHTEFFLKLKSNAIANAYLFYGEEEFVKESARLQLLDAILPENRDFNLTILDTDKAEPIRDACESLPFGSQYRAVINNRLLTDKEGRFMADYLDDMPPQTVLLIYLKGRADSKSTLFKKFKSLGANVEFATLSESEIRRWILSKIRRAGISMPGDALKSFITLVGPLMLNISNELEKLMGYVGPGGVITSQIVDNIVVKNLEYRLYTMFDALLSGNKAQGLLELDNILGFKPEEESLAVAGYLLSCFKNMLSVFDLRRAGASFGEIMKRLNMRDFALKNIERNLSAFSRSDLLEAVARFSDISYINASGRLNAKDALYDAVSAVFLK